MKVLVTGGLGHIGSKLIRSFSTRNDIKEIIIFDNLHTERYCSLMSLPTNKKYTFIEGDITNNEDLKNVIKNVDIVIHLAALTNAPETQKIPELTNKVNHIAVKNILKISKENGVKKFFFPSTTSVYGPAIGLIDENYTKYNPLTEYAKTKLLAERGVIDINGDMKTCVARLGTIYGYSVGMRFHTAVNKFIFQSVFDQPITVWEDALDQKRPYLDINDAIRFIEYFIDNSDPKFFGDVYNILTNNSTVREVVDTIKKNIGSVKIKLVKNPIINQQSYEVSREKIESLGFKFTGSMSMGIKETIDVFKTFL